MNDEGHSVTERQALCNATLVGGDLDQAGTVA